MEVCGFRARMWEGVNWMVYFLRWGERKEMSFIWIRDLVSISVEDCAVSGRDFVVGGGWLLVVSAVDGLEPSTLRFLKEEDPSVCSSSTLSLLPSRS